MYKWYLFRFILEIYLVTRQLTLLPKMAILRPSKFLSNMELKKIQRITMEQLHYILLPIMVIWIFVNLSLIMWHRFVASISTFARYSKNFKFIFCYIRLFGKNLGKCCDFFLVKKSVKKVNCILKYRMNPEHLNFEIKVSFDQILMSFKRLKDSPQTSDNQEKSWGQ